jgi:hypothetical protein
VSGVLGIAIDPHAQLFRKEVACAGAAPARPSSWMRSVERCLMVS